MSILRRGVNIAAEDRCSPVGVYGPGTRL